MVEDALHETYCHENLDHTWEPIETMQDEMEDKAPALLEELDEQNRIFRSCQYLWNYLLSHHQF
jgi:hypothetical protein